MHRPDVHLRTEKQEQHETVTAESVAEVIRPLLLHLPLDIYRTRQNRWWFYSDNKRAIRYEQLSTLPPPHTHTPSSTSNDEDEGVNERLPLDQFTTDF